MVHEQSKIHIRWAVLCLVERAEPEPNTRINCLLSHRRAVLVFQSSFNSHFSSTFTICARWVSVCNWHSFNTNYSITEPPSVESQNLYRTRLNTCEARINHPNDNNSFFHSYINTYWNKSNHTAFKSHVWRSEKHVLWIWGIGISYITIIQISASCLRKLFTYTLVW